MYPGNIYKRVFITELIRDMQRLEVILTFSLCRTRVHDGGIKKVARQFNYRFQFLKIWKIELLFVKLCSLILFPYFARFYCHLLICTRSGFVLNVRYEKGGSGKGTTFVISLVTQAKLQRWPNRTELRSMDSYNQIFSRFQKYKRKVPPPSPLFGQKKNTF